MIYKMVYDEDNHEDIEVDEPYDEVGDSNSNSNSTHELIMIIKKYYNEDVMFSSYTKSFDSDLLRFFRRFYDIGLLTLQQFKILENSLKFAQDKVAFMLLLEQKIGKKYTQAFDVLEVMLADPVNNTDIKEHLKRSIIRKIKERYK
jgi:hypothetical protein